MGETQPISQPISQPIWFLIILSRHVKRPCFLSYSLHTNTIRAAEMTQHLVRNCQTFGWLFKRFRRLLLALAWLTGQLIDWPANWQTSRKVAQCHIQVVKWDSNFKINFCMFSYSTKRLSPKRPFQIKPNEQYFLWYCLWCCTRWF